MPAVDPKNPDIVYMRQHRDLEVGRRRQDLDRLSRRARAATTTRTSGSIRTIPNIILLASDQGAIITVNGGETWSSWYNQPTAQMYHVNADNAFPYRVCGGQQESGSACVSSRGNDGEITFRDWHPVGVEEYGYVAPDPLDPDIVYGGKVTRYDRRTATGAERRARSGPARRTIRVLRTAAAHVLAGRSAPAVLRGEHAVETRDGGQELEADQPRPDAQDLGGAGASVGIFKSDKSAEPTQRGVIYAVAPSPLGRQPHLGRHRRRPDLAHDRRRRELERTSRRPS